MSGILGQGPIFIVSLMLVLGLVVVVHELGHYLAGRLFGAAAESFSVGFGSPIFEVKDKRNTRWRVNWIPLGGFVKFVGESQTAGDIGQVEEGPIGKKYMDLTVGQRSIVSVAGPLANFVLAIFLFALISLNFGKPVQQVTIVGFADEVSPARDAGLQAGDRLISINGKEISQLGEARRMITLATGNRLAFIVKRGSEEVPLTVVPVRMEIDNGVGQTARMGAIGAILDPVAVGHEDFTLVQALGEGTRETRDVIVLTGRMLGRMVSGREPLTQLSGPVGIGDLTRRAVNNTLDVVEVPLSRRLTAIGWMLLQISAFISVGIGLFNLLPLPVLDGGHLVFNAYEAVTGSVLPERIQEISLKFGVVFLLSVAGFVTISDIIRTGVFQGLGG